MAFGAGLQINKDQSHLNRGIEHMQHERPIMTDGEGKNTFIKDGRHFFMGREVSADEYNKGMEKYNELLETELEEKRRALLN